MRPTSTSSGLASTEPVSPAHANGEVRQDPGAAQSVNVRPVRKAYEQVADQLRELIMAGELEMRDHLTYLRPYYERTWRSAERAVART